MWVEFVVYLYMQQENYMATLKAAKKKEEEVTAEVEFLVHVF
jgi:hypothetical protein